MNRSLFLLFIILFSCLLNTITAHKTKKSTIFSIHPRLIWQERDENTVKYLISNDSLFNKIHRNILNKSNKILTLPILVREMKGKRLLPVSREARQRITLLSYVYRITKDRKYADRAIEEMLNISRFSDWNPSHFLDVAEMALGLAIGYDWLYDVLEIKQRQYIVDAINKKAFTPAFDKKYSGFYRDTNNWNSVCNAGLACAAIATFDELQNEAENIIDKCIDTNPLILESYAPDGGYPEGCGYWGYGTSFEVLLMDALTQVYNQDFGLSEYPGFMQTAEFMQFMTAPSGMCFNFGDSGTSMPLHAAYWWFAYKSNDISLLKFINQKFQDNIYNLGDKGFLPFALIFASRLNNLHNIRSDKNKNFWLNRGITPVFAYRQGWNSKNDAYLAVKGGSASTTHAHMDAGSFIYEKDGIRWAIDLGSQDYYSIEKEGINLWDMTQDSPRWEIMRMRNDCHNTLTVDSGRHIVSAKAEIIDTLTSNAVKGAVIDLTTTLGKVETAIRTIFLDDKNNLHIIDSISTINDIDLTWVMVTPSTPTIIAENSIRLEKNGRSMLLTIDSPIDVKPHIWSNTPLHYYDTPNEGTWRIGYTVEIPSQRTLKILVNISEIDQYQYRQKTNIP